MNKMLDQSCGSPYRSRFETPDMNRSGSASMCAQFANRLRSVFVLPRSENQPDQFVILLRQVEEKLGEQR